MFVERTSIALVLALGLALPLVGCEDPAAGVPKATVGSAQPAKSAAATATAAATAAATGAASAAPVVEAAPSAKPAGAIDVSADNTKVEFTGSKVTGKHDGIFQKVGGWLALDADKPEQSKFFIEIDIASVKTDSEKLDGHLKSDDFFAIDKFPTATFTSTEIKAGGEGGATHTISGNLKMRGVEKPVSFPATVKVEAGAVTAKAEFAINRKDWGIAYEGKKDDLIRDDVVIKLSLDMKR